jgi:hypothetical protein
VLVAQTPTPNVRLGLWEMSMTVDMGGAMSGIDMSKMTPEQQAMAGAMMRGRGMAPMQMKTCMTAEKLAKAGVVPDRPGQTCTSKVLKSSATTLDYIQTCTGSMPSTSEMHVEAASPTSITVTGKTTTTMRGQAQTATLSMTGKWVGQACGDVK